MNPFLGDIKRRELQGTAKDDVLFFILPFAKKQLYFQVKK